MTVATLFSTQVVQAGTSAAENPGSHEHPKTQRSLTPTVKPSSSRKSGPSKNYCEDNTVTIERIARGESDKASQAIRAHGSLWWGC